MDGVVVHAEHVYRGTPVGVTVFFFIITVFVLSLLAWEVIKCFKKKDARRWGWAALLAFNIGFFGSCDVAILNSTLTIHTDKIVTIDDSVRFNDFYNHYEIINQDGSLYTVRELLIEETIPEEAGDNE